MAKKYCKDCKFINSHGKKYCGPYIRVGVRIDDYHSKNHLIRRSKLGVHEKSKKNERKRLTKV